MLEYENDQEERLIQRSIVMKVLDEIELSFEDGVQRILEGEIGPWGELEEQFPGISLNRIFSSLDPKQINRLINLAEEQDNDYKAPRFSNYFFVNTPSEHDPFSIAKLLAGWKGSIEFTYVESLPASPPAPAPTEPFLDDQAYLGPPEIGTGQIHFGGINLRAVWDAEAVGSSGEDISFVDIEEGWFFNHPDLITPAGAPFITAVSAGENKEEFAHGTCVLGIIAAQDNDVGCIGIARNSTGNAVSIWKTMSIKDIVNAIAVGIVLLAPAGPIPVTGNVMLLEVQIRRCEAHSPTDPTQYFKRLPIETEKLIFEAIRLATAVGIVVVEAAGNGEWDAMGDCGQPDPKPAGQADGIFLDDVQDNMGKFIFRPGHPDQRDSGAIMVASANALDIDAGRLPSSNHGARIDCFAWGNSVVTPTLPSDLEFDDDGDGYTVNFRGTSSAAAIVAGAAIVMQSLALARPGGSRLEPFHLREIMKATGTEPTDTTQGIGVMPDLNNFRLTPIQDPFVRDNLVDNGIPHDGPLAHSPDIIVRPAVGPGSVGGGVADFGPASGTVESVPVGSTVTPTIPHRVYVRARNRGVSTAADVRATVYYSPPSSLITPHDWNPIGTTVNGIDIPADMTTITVLEPIDWPVAQLPPVDPDPNKNHYCFIATIGNGEDPNPIPDHTVLPAMTFDQFYQLIRNNNNVTWRNFNVVPLSMAAGPALLVLPFWVQGAWDEARQMQLEIVPQLPDGFQIYLRGEDDLVKELLKPETIGLKLDEDGRILLKRYGSMLFNSAQFPGKYESLAELIVEVPPAPAPGEYLLFARQLFQGVEVGRISWLLKVDG